MLGMILSINPIFLHYFDHLLNSFCLSYLTRKAFQFCQNRLFVIFFMKSVNIPGLLIINMAEVKFFKLFLTLLNMSPNIIRRLHNFPKSRLNNHCGFTFMIFKHDRACSQCTSHWRNQYNVKI